MVFPMYVVRVPELLRMKEARPHQVLRAEGVLEEYDPRLGVAIFVSHQWLSRHHPDPSFAQLSVLQGILRRLASGKLQVQVDLASLIIFKTKLSVRVSDLLPAASGCVWYDYFSVPQHLVPAVEGEPKTKVEEDAAKAACSIPAYIRACKFFMILAPPLAHVDDPDQMVDYHSWKQRGWCRFERIARVLSPRQTHLLVAWKEDTLFQVAPQDYLMDAVGDGFFSVEEDRAQLAPIMVALLQSKLQSLLELRDLHRYRRMLSARESILRGLPGISPRDCFAPGFVVAAPTPPTTSKQTVEAFLRLYGLASAADRAEGGAEAILFAARAGDQAAVKALLECRAEVNAREGADDSEFLAVRGNTPLHIASMFSSASLVRLLLRYHADLEARDAGGFVPLMSCSFGGREENVETLLEAKACLSTKEPFGSTALHAAAMLGRANICCALIQAGASAAPNKEGCSPILWAAVFGGGRPTMEALLTAPDANIEARWRAHWFSPPWLLLGTLSIPHRLWGSQQTFAVLAHQAQGSTPLMLASFLGNIGEARALVAAGADLVACNARGHTAADLGQLAGLHPRNVAYLRDPQFKDEQGKAAAELQRLQEHVTALTTRISELEDNASGNGNGNGGNYMGDNSNAFFNVQASNADHGNYMCNFKSLRTGLEASDADNGNHMGNLKSLPGGPEAGHVAQIEVEKRIQEHESKSAKYVQASPSSMVIELVN